MSKGGRFFFVVDRLGLRLIDVFTSLEIKIRQRLGRGIRSTKIIFYTAL